MLGINELFEGICISRYSNADITQVFYPPSQFALAKIGLMERKPRALEKGLEEIVSKPEFPFTKGIVARYGKIEDKILEERVIGRFGTAKLLTKPVVVEWESTAGGVLHVRIRRRGDSRGERDRTVVIPEGLSYDLADLSCHCDCDIYEQNFGKGRFYSKDPVNTQVCCYHAASVMLKAGKAPFNISKELALESLLRSVGYERMAQEKYFSIDDFLMQQDILTPECKALLEEGKVRIQVLKHSKWFYNEARGITEKLFKLLEKQGYKFHGFAVDFRGYYQVTSPFFVKDNARTAHIIYSEKFLIPLLALKVSQETWIAEKRELPEEMIGKPLDNIGKIFLETDDKSRKTVVTGLHLPTRIKGLGLNAEERAYISKFY